MVLEVKNGVTFGSEGRSNDREETRGDFLMLFFDLNGDYMGDSLLVFYELICFYITLKWEKT